MTDNGEILDWLEPGSFAEVFRRLRLRAGYRSQTDLAAAMDSSQSVISDIERGKTTNPQPDTLARFVEALRSGPNPVQYITESYLERVIARSTPEQSRGNWQWIELGAWYETLPEPMKRYVYALLLGLREVVDRGLEYRPPEQ